MHNAIAFHIVKIQKINKDFFIASGRFTYGSQIIKIFFMYYVYFYIFCSTLEVETSKLYIIRMFPLFICLLFFSFRVKIHLLFGSNYKYEVFQKSFETFNKRALYQT